MIKISSSFFIVWITTEHSTFTPTLFSSSSKALRIMLELWFTGNTLKPSLAIVSTPILAKKSLKNVSNYSFCLISLNQISDKIQDFYSEKTTKNN